MRLDVNVPWLQFHYTEEQLNDANIIESSITAKYWDSDLSQWIEIPGINLNASENLVSFDDARVANFFILTGDTPTSVNNTNTSTIPDQFELKQNYPNPFNPTTTIEFSLPQKASVELTVYNILGKKVVNLADGNFDAGSYSITFDAKGLPSGIYFYQLKTDNFYKVKKMQLIK